MTQEERGMEESYNESGDKGEHRGEKSDGAESDMTEDAKEQRRKLLEEKGE